MTRLFLDFETRSRVDLKKHGLSRYVRDPSTKALMLAWAVDDGPVEQVVFATGEKAPKRLRELLRDPSVIKSAFNARFERLVFKHVLGLDIPVEQWRCTMVMAMSLSLPGSLAKVGEVVDLPEDKKKLARGKLLIRKFSVPRKPTKNKPWEFNDHLTDPEDWREFCAYNVGDVEAERAIYKRIRKWDLPEHEWDLYCLDQRINDAGIPVNMRVVRNAIKVADTIVAERLDELAGITGLSNPNSTQQLLPWLQERGYPYEDLKKGHVARALEDARSEPPELIGADDDLIRALELRAETSKTSVKKYNALEKATDDDGCLRGTFQFCGAGRTWRWAGRRFQAQNLARPIKELEKTLAGDVKNLEWLDAEAIEMLYPDPMGLLSSCVRPVVQAGPGKMFVDADLNAIENRVVGWVAHDERILQVFANDRCPYLDFGSQLFGESYEALWHDYKVLGNKAKRTFSKPPVLGCAYLLGPGERRENPKTGEIEATGLLGYALAMGVEMTQEQSTEAVRLWRETYYRVPEFWREIDSAARRCVATGRSFDAGPVTFDRSGPFMRMRLPSGRYLHYCRPKIEPVRTPWGEVKDSVTFENLDFANRWTRVSTHAGKWTENCVQAIARDVLAHGMMMAAKEGLDLRLHIHDELIAVVDENLADEKLEVLKQCMADQPAWAKGLPLAAEGSISPVMLKD